MAQAQHAPNIRNAQEVFEAAIQSGYLSARPGMHHYAGNWMYMSDDENGHAMFKNINTREYKHFPV